MRPAQLRALRLRWTKADPTVTSESVTAQTVPPVHGTGVTVGPTSMSNSMDP